MCLGLGMRLAYSSLRCSTLIGSQSSWLLWPMGLGERSTHKALSIKHNCCNVWSRFNKVAYQYQCRGGVACWKMIEYPTLIVSQIPLYIWLSRHILFKIASLGQVTAGNMRDATSFGHMAFVVGHFPTGVSIFSTKQKCFRQILPGVLLRNGPAGHPHLVWLLVSKVV